MADVFLSYSSKDRGVATHVERALSGAGYEVFWDQETPVGRDWNAWIGEKLANAKIVIVLWSRASAASDNVIHEATIAKSAGRLIPALTESLRDTDFPMGFYNLQGADLRGFRGGDHPGMTKLLAAVEGRIGKPGAPPPPSAPRKRSPLPLVLAAVAAVLLIAGGIGVFALNRPGSAPVAPVPAPAASAPVQTVVAPSVIAPPSVLVASTPPEPAPSAAPPTVLASLATPPKPASVVAPPADVPVSVMPKSAAPPSSAAPRPATASKGVELTRDFPEAPVLMRLPGGTFRMGDLQGDGQSDEKPWRSMKIAPFAVGKFEVTFAEWDACVAGGGCDGYRPSDLGWGRGPMPVINVNWQDAQRYVAWLNARMDALGKPQRYRLLSEAEWEYMARSNTETSFWKNDFADHYYANYGTDTCCNGRAAGRDSYYYTAPIGKFPSNDFGIHDAAGNVTEWVADCYAGYNAAFGDGSPVKGAGANCTLRAARGGSWTSDPNGIRFSKRAAHSPGYRANNIGFRVARSP